MRGSSLQASKQERKDGLFESIAPFVLVKNAPNLKVNELVGLAFQNNQASVLGYFAELALLFYVHPNLQKIIKLVESSKTEKKELLVTTTKINFPELFERNAIALKWNLLVRGNVKDQLDRWSKWEQSQKKS